MKNSFSSCKRPKVLVLCPTRRDIRELTSIAQSQDIELIFYGDDASEHLADFDVLSFIEDVKALSAHLDLSGIISTDDYPGSIIASVMARHLGLPGPDPEKLLSFQHKFHSREIQRGLVPHAVPEFGLVDPFCDPFPQAPLQYPFFLKPVKSFLSLMANVISCENDYQRALKDARRNIPFLVAPFNDLLNFYAALKHNGDFLIAEDLMCGVQATVEGYMWGGEFTLIDITDSIMYTGTQSFQRFECPSSLPKLVQEEMESIARQCIEGAGFETGIFNIEMFYNAADNSIKIIEVNPRMCSQFADLMEKLHGVNTYEIQLDLALGRKPTFTRNAGRDKIAASFVSRVFQDALVTRIPISDEIAQITKAFPGIRVEVLAKKGHFLSDEPQDANSFRYLILNLGAESREVLEEKLLQAKKLTVFELCPRV